MNPYFTGFLDLKHVIKVKFTHTFGKGQKVLRNRIKPSGENEKSDTAGKSGKIKKCVCPLPIYSVDDVSKALARALTVAYTASW